MAVVLLARVAAEAVVPPSLLASSASCTIKVVVLVRVRVPRTVKVLMEPSKCSPRAAGGRSSS
jgi:hypothetical protein